MDEKQYISSVKLVDGSIYNIKDAEALKIANEAKSAAETVTNVVNDFATVATTGNINDVIQTTGDILIFDCGGIPKNL